MEHIGIPQEETTPVRGIIKYNKQKQRWGCTKCAHAENPKIKKT